MQPVWNFWVVIKWSSVERSFFYIRRGPRLPGEGNQSANVGGDVRLDAPARLSIKASLTLRSRWTSWSAPLSRASSWSLTASRYLIWLVANLLRNRSIIRRWWWGKGKQTSIKEINFASLLVRSREGFLETCITFPELVTSSLFWLDTLLANGFTAPNRDYKEMVV